MHAPSNHAGSDGSLGALNASSVLIALAATGTGGGRLSAIARGVRSTGGRSSPALAAGKVMRATTPRGVGHPPGGWGVAVGGYGLDRTVATGYRNWGGGGGGVLCFYVVFKPDLFYSFREGRVAPQRIAVREKGAWV